MYRKSVLVYALSLLTMHFIRIVATKYDIAVPISCCESSSMTSILALCCVVLCCVVLCCVVLCCAVLCCVVLCCVVLCCVVLCCDMIT